MATVNRTSLRDALEELKARSAALHEAPEPELAEYRALVVTTHPPPAAGT